MLKYQCDQQPMWSATFKEPLRCNAAPMVINNLLLQMEWLLYHLQSNRTRDYTGKLMFTGACANESQVINSFVRDFIKFHGNKQLFNTVFNLKTSLTLDLKYGPSSRLSWTDWSQDNGWQSSSFSSRRKIMILIISRLLHLSHLHLKLIFRNIKGIFLTKKK